jgi:hypothetical protein
MKRSQLSDGAGVPMATVSAPANTRDDARLGQTLDALKDFAPLPADVTVHLDAGYDYRPCRDALEERGLHGQIAARGTPAPIQVGRRWVIERHHPCPAAGRLVPLGHPTTITPHPRTYWRTPLQAVVPNACARCFLATALTVGCTRFRRRSGNRIRRLATRATVHWTRPAAAASPAATPAAITDPMRP